MGGGGKCVAVAEAAYPEKELDGYGSGQGDRKSTRLNSSHPSISYAVFCLKKKKSAHYFRTPAHYLLKDSRNRNLRWSRVTRERLASTANASDGLLSFPWPRATAASYVHTI